MKRPYISNLRKPGRKVSENFTLSSRFIDIVYNGHAEEYEDIADYVRHDCVKAVRIG